MGGQGRFVRGDSSCDRRCKGGALAGGCLQRDTSAAAAELALSCQCLRFHGTFITICHSFNGVACVSCHLPLPPCAPPAHTHTLIGELSHMAPSHPCLLGASWATVGTGAWQGGPDSPGLWPWSRNQNITVPTWEPWSVPVSILMDVSAILMWAVGQQ